MNAHKPYFCHFAMYFFVKAHAKPINIMKCTFLKIRLIFVGWNPLYWLFGPKNQSFRNKSGKTQPIRTKFGIRGQVKGWQRSGNFGRDWPIWGKMGAGTSPAEREFFLVVIQRTFLQLRNCQFSPNLATKRILVSNRWLRKDIFENCHFRGTCPQSLKSKVGQIGTSLRAGYRSRDALQTDTVYSTL